MLVHYAVEAVVGLFVFGCIIFFVSTLWVVVP